MEEQKNFEAQTSNEKDQFTTVEQCMGHIEDQDRYIAQLEQQLDKAKARVKFYEDFSNRSLIKLNFCVNLLKYSGNDVLAKIAQKVDKAYEL